MYSLPGIMTLMAFTLLFYAVAGFYNRCRQTERSLPVCARQRRQAHVDMVVRYSAYHAKHRTPHELAQFNRRARIFRNIRDFEDSGEVSRHVFDGVIDDRPLPVRVRVRVNRRYVHAALKTYRKLLQLFPAR